LEQPLINCYRSYQRGFSPRTPTIRQLSYSNLNQAFVKNQQSLFESSPEPWELDDQPQVMIATVVFSTGPSQPFDYLIPDGLISQVVPGRRVYVPFGRSNRPILGYCVEVENRPLTSRKVKPIKSVLDEQTLLSKRMLTLTRWMADYYLCGWGQVLEAVVPAAVRGNAGTREVTLLSVSSQVATQLPALKLSPKQQQALQILAVSPRPLTPPELAQQANCTTAPINELRKKGLIQTEIRRVSHAHFDDESHEREQPKELNPDQQAALAVILDSVGAENPVPILLHGVTGSGKTEVYIQAIENVVAQDRQAIVLVPEISLTPQTKQRFQARFNQIAVLHSHMSDVERHWQWKRIAAGQVDVVVGARSAIFAPTPRLGMIVIDEEHDGSFKQDSLPRYHAREVAAERARLEGIPLVLGSATPSLETWYRAKSRVYQQVAMPSRVGNRPMPYVRTIDLRVEKNPGSRGAISRQLYLAMRRTLQDEGQIILLLNRRGHSTHIQCPACGHVAECPHCEMPLTLHLENATANCHYCDYKIKAPNNCPECQFTGIRFSGIGTQKLETEVRAKFKEWPSIRMDSDTMRKPGSHEQALERFRSGEIRILVGTQMIAKGLDFPNVLLVGVINADTALHFPDTRAGERTFQLITQVAGRTGRGNKGGEVLVQTLSPDHPAIEAATRHNYQMFAMKELPFRREFMLSPFAHMIRIVARGPLQSQVELFLGELADKFTQYAAEQKFEVQLQGPAPAPIEKLRGNYRYHLLLKSVSLDAMRRTVEHCRTGLTPPKDVAWIVDVDPLDMM